MGTKSPQATLGIVTDDCINSLLILSKIKLQIIL